MKGEADSITATGVDELVSGKRQAPRFEVQLPIRVKGVHGEFEGVVKDISVGGALVHLPIAQLAGEGAGRLGPAEQFALLERHFRDSFDLVFEGRDVVVEAQVVRLLVSSEEEERDPQLALGCQFVQKLTTSQQDALGFGAEAAALVPWDDATETYTPEWTLDSGSPVNAFLFDGRGGVVGPPCIGLVRALGLTSFIVRLSNVTRREVHAYMSGRTVHARIMHGQKELLAVDTQFVTARYCDYPSPGVEVLLATEAPLPRAVRKHFHRG